MEPAEAKENGGLRETVRVNRGWKISPTMGNGKRVSVTILTEGVYEGHGWTDPYLLRQILRRTQTDSNFLLCHPRNHGHRLKQFPKFLIQMLKMHLRSQHHAGDDRRRSERGRKQVQARYQ